MTTKTKVLFDPAKLLSLSPEGHDGATCPHCGAGCFVGIDVDATQSQPFTPPDYYDLYYYDGEIGSYEVVVCGKCDRIVWYAADYFRPDREINEILAFLEIGSGARTDLVERARYLLAKSRVSTMVAMFGSSYEVMALPNKHKDDPNNA